MDLSMSLNCSVLYSIQTMTNLDMLQEDALFPWLADGSMADSLDNNYNADLLDAMADQFEDEQEAMRETDPQEWEGYDDES